MGLSGIGHTDIKSSSFGYETKFPANKQNFDDMFKNYFKQNSDDGRFGLHQQLQSLDLRS